MKIQVTQSHIMQNGACAVTCPIACALRDAGFTDVRVGPHIIDASGQRFRTPENARKFQADYDRTLPVRPFEFELGEPL